MSKGKETQTNELRVGGLYSVYGRQGYALAKILALDEGGVHIRLYKNRFRARPAAIDVALLKLGIFRDADGFGIGHLPMTLEAFAAWRPVLLFEQPVTEDELDGYYYWKNAAGGYLHDLDYGQNIERAVDLIKRDRTTWN